MAQSQKFSVSIPAGTTVDVMAGRAIQEVDKRFGRTGANVSIFATAAATGLQISAGVGVDVPIQPSEPNVVAGGVVDTNKDLVGSFRAQGGDLLRLPVTSTAIAAVVISVLVVIS